MFLKQINGKSSSIGNDIDCGTDKAYLHKIIKRGFICLLNIFRIEMRRRFTWDFTLITTTPTRILRGEMSVPAGLSAFTTHAFIFFWMDLSEFEWTTAARCSYLTSDRGFSLILLSDTNHLQPFDVKFVPAGT